MKHLLTTVIYLCLVPSWPCSESHGQCETDWAWTHLWTASPRKTHRLIHTMTDRGLTEGGKEKNMNIKNGRELLDEININTIWHMANNNPVASALTTVAWNNCSGRTKSSQKQPHLHNQKYIWFLWHCRH